MYISIINKDNLKKDYDISSNNVTIGRSNNNTISIPDSKISRNHLLVVKDGNIYRIKDLGSTNGTYLDGKKIKKNMTYTINNNSNIKVGNTIIYVGSKSTFTHSDAVQVETYHKNYALKGMKGIDSSVNNYSAKGQRLGTEMEYAMHANKSFVGPAWLSFFLYYIGFWIGGLVANILFLNSARYTKRIINRDPPGMGCLWALIWLQIIPLAIIIFVILVLVNVISFAGITSFTSY